MEARLPAHMEVSALIRRVESEGGFGMVLSKGERDAGTLMVVLVERGRNSRAYERMPQLDGTRKWTMSREQNTEKHWEFAEFLERRGQQDPDLWIVELDIADGVRFIEAR
ncbi:DUF1491 family protein [Novosphingobium sp. BW1]|uniref:DUF1491 family protein n=1 Tax=Novosphingobium sp. BW1 TaxID=2592621 RepID=UPI0011DED649|nr:DUF1491 family protein [Novosphingobium sp. BW1]TYC89966.1 DUF1491 family protein [Novosphingobium sp. BW1]